MLNLSPVELLVILALGLIVLGPHKLPEMARQVGRVVQQVRRMASGFQAEMQEAIREVDMRDAMAEAMADAERVNGAAPAPPLAPPPPASGPPERPGEPDDDLN